MNLIVAVTKNLGIGCNGDLLVKIPEDLAFFRAKTLNKVVIMGHSTFKSLPNGKPLKDRVNIVLSNDRSLNIEGAIVCNTISEIFDAVKDYNTDDVYVIGGQSVYEQMLDYCSFAYITCFDIEKDADKFFPDIEKIGNWVLVNQSEKKHHDGIDFIFKEYKHIKK